MADKILIVGGGVAGLMAKNRLEALGYKPDLVEKANALRAEGAGLVLAANVMKVFRAAGLEAAVLEKAQVLDTLLSADQNGREIGRLDLKKIHEERGYPSITIHRHDLHDILANSVDQESIRISHKLVSLKHSGTGYEVGFENGETETYDRVIGADGIHSQVREQLFGPVGLRHTRQGCWRFVMALPEGVDPRVAIEMWGDRKRVGIIPIGGGRVYCFMVALMQGGEAAMDARAALGLFDEFEGEWAKIKQAADPDSLEILFGELADAEAITLDKDGVVLIGDAAHSTTPNLGQGAAMGIESAYVFSEFLKEHGFDEAIELYVSKRHNKVRTIREKSMMMGNLAHTKSRFKQGLRNFIMRLLPQAMTQREFEKSIFDD